MARKPAHILAAAVKPQGRDAIWAAIRAQQSFTRRSIVDATDVPMKTLTDYLECLIAAGHISASKEPGEDGRVRYALVRDTGMETPRVRKDGSPVTQGARGEQMWRTMKLLRQFTAADLAVAASIPTSEVSLDHARDYCKRLAAVGYLAVIGGGRPGHASLFRFCRDTGPKPPQIQRVKQVFDPNLGRVVTRCSEEILP